MADYYGTDTVVSELRENGLLIIRINRPDMANALNGATSKAMENIMNNAETDPAVRAIIVTGTGKVFCAGEDLSELSEGGECQTVTEHGFGGLTARTCSKPVIAACNGSAAGGGMEIALSCDMVVASERAKFGCTEVGLGIIPGANGCARATAIVGPAKAKQLVMLTEMVPGKQAYDLGLLNWYVEGDAELSAKAVEAKKAFKAAKKAGAENLDELKAANKAAEAAAAKAEYDAIYAKAVEVAKTLMTKPACALASAKAAINKAAIETIAAGKAAETTEFTLLFNTHDQKEGMAAMIEKRPAVFTNN